MMNPSGSLRESRPEETEYSSHFYSGESSLLSTQPSLAFDPRQDAQAQSLLSSLPSAQQRNPFISRSFCAVCNDKARGCNFGAITCASCKEFFRRNAFKTKKLKCYFQSKCEINVFSRRFCAACRLLRCYQIGMKSEYIMSEQEKSERQAKIIEKKQFSNTRPGLKMANEFGAKGVKFEETLTNSMLSNLEPVTSFNSDDRRILEETDPLANIKEEFTDFGSDLDLEQLFQPTSVAFGSMDTNNFGTYCSVSNNNEMTSYFNTGDGLLMSNYSTPKAEELPPVQSFELSSTTFNVASTMFDQDDEVEESRKTPNSQSNEIKNEFEALQELESETMRRLLRKVKIIRESNFYQTKYCLLLRARSSNKCLMHHEHCKLKYLTTIVQIMQAETIQELPIDQKHIDLLKIAEILTFNFIKMCKKLHAFQMLSQDDQVVLVKGGVMETLIMWSIMNINLDNECWEVMDLNRNFKFSLKLELLKEAHPELFEEHRKYALSFEPEWRFDDTLMSLMVVITLFNEHRLRLKNVEQVKKTRLCFERLLRTYLGTLYDDDLVDEVFRRLYRQIQATEEISQFHVKAYFDVNAHEVTRNRLGGVYMEIFDLNI